MGIGGGHCVIGCQDKVRKKVGDEVVDVHDITGKEVKRKGVLSLSCCHVEIINKGGSNLGYELIAVDEKSYMECECS